MDEIVNQLLVHLANNPSDWGRRLELAERYFSYDAHEEIAELFRQAPNPPSSQHHAHQAVELTAGADLSGLNQVLSNFAAANANDAWAHYVYARILTHQNRLNEARTEYNLAVSIDSSKKDVELETLLEQSKTPEGGKESAAMQAAPREPVEDFVGKTFMVALGEAAKPKKKESNEREKKLALITSVVVHIILLISFAWVVTFSAPMNPPQIEAVSVHSLDEDSLSGHKAKKTQSEVLESADSRVPLSMESVSLIGAPEFQAQVDSFAPVGLGNYGGGSMSFGKGTGGGTVSFFGSKTRARRVVFVVDFSASMIIGEREKLMRQELAKSVKNLPESVEYALIFFSGPAWYAGQKVSAAEKLGKHVGNTVIDRNNRYVWYEGWDEQDRKLTPKQTANYHFSQGPDRLPPGKYKRASGINLRNSLEAIKTTPLMFGTDWRWPLMMAMNMKPDVIYFMTDGEFGVPRGVTKKEMINNLLSYNSKQSNAQINTICMQVLTARGELEQLSDGSDGEFTLIKSDGTAVSGADLE